MGAGGWFHPNEREPPGDACGRSPVYVAHSSDDSVQRTKLGRKVEAARVDHWICKPVDIGVASTLAAGPHPACRPGVSVNIA